MKTIQTEVPEQLYKKSQSFGSSPFAFFMDGR